MGKMYENCTIINDYLQYRVHCTIVSNAYTLLSGYNLENQLKLLMIN